MFPNLPTEFTTDSRWLLSTIGCFLPVFKMLAVAVMKAFIPCNLFHEVLVTNIVFKPCHVVPNETLRHTNKWALNHRIIFIVLQDTIRWQIFGFHMTSRRQLSAHDRRALFPDDRRTFCGQRSSAITWKQGFPLILLKIKNDCTMRWWSKFPAETLICYIKGRWSRHLKGKVFLKTKTLW